MYVISTDGPKHLLRVDVRGFWDKATLERFRAELPGMREGLASSGELRVLINALGASPQSQDVTTDLFAFLNPMEGKAARLAFVTDSAVIALQARRLFARPGLCITDSIAAAEAFLFAAP